MRARVVVGSVLLAACGDDAAPRVLDAPVLPPDLLVYYPMDYTAAGTVRDAKGHSQGFCTGGSCPTDVPGVYDGALAFDGDDMVGIVSTTALDSVSEYTAALWVRRDAEGPACLFGKRAGSFDGNTWQLCIDANNIVTLTSYTGTMNVITSTSATLTSAWHHLAITWASQIETFYFDGDPISIAPVTKVWDDGRLLIGGDVDEDNPTSFFVGAIDDVRFYSRALGAAEIRRL